MPRAWRHMSIATTVAVVAAVCAFGVATDAASPAGSAARVTRQATAAMPPAPADVNPAAAPAKALLDQYCVRCHSEKTKAGDLVLEKIDTVHVGAGAEVWERVVRKLRGGLMPPAGMPRPEKPAMDTFILSLETAIDRSAQASPDPGRPVAHRLNRVEYTNAIRDLLDLQIDGPALLPADDAGFGFDNIGDVLSISSGLVERYLIAAQKISRIAVGDPTIPPTVEQYNVPYLSLRQDDRLNEDLPLGSRGGIVVRHTFPVDAEYVIKLRLQRNAISLGSALRGLDVKNLIELSVDGERVQTFTIGDKLTPAEPGSAEANKNSADDQERDGDARLDVRLPLRAGPRTIGIAFQQANYEFEGLGPALFPVASYGHTAGKVRADGDYGKVLAGLDNLQIVGPYHAVRPMNTPTRRRLFPCYPATAAAEEPCARTIISTLARRAYRRPVTAADLSTLLEFYTAGRGEADFDTGIQWVLKRVLTDPDFLVRMEHQPPNAPAMYRITDVELASRLSFFLWSTIPDDQLLNLAARGQLRSPGVLEQQVRRMLADPRAHSLVENFFGQWLWVRNMGTIRPDRFQFPDFDENLRDAFRRETDLFIESQLREDRPVPELLTANYTFVNERLALFYGIPEVSGTHFRRVAITDPARGGILGQGSLLTVTSYANRTSPVVRGKWVLENLLNTPPPVPPANVPPFPDGEDMASMSVRQRMEVHRKNPVCAACHSRLDPLGFALENFDAIGRWRQMDGSSAVDASGAFPDGLKFSGPSEFRKGLLQHQDAFIATVTEKMMTYALGRGAEYYDRPAIRRIARDIGTKDYRWSSLVLGIVNSMPFQMRRRSES